MAVGKTLTVYLAADVGRLSRGLGSAERDVRTFGSSIDGMGSRLTSMLGPALIGAGIAAGALAVKLGTDGVKAAMDDEAAAAKLATTLGNLGLSHDTTAVESMIDSLQRETGVADDNLRPAFDRLVRSIGNTGEATSALKLAMDISAGSGKSLDSVVQALGKAYDGNTAGLSKLGAGIDSAILKTGNMDKITAALASTFQGQAKAASETYAGRLARLSVGFDELKESFGAGFLEGLSSVDDKTGQVTDKMAELEPKMKKLGKATFDTGVALVDSGTAALDFKDSIETAANFLVSRFSISLIRNADALGLVSDEAGAAADAEYQLYLATNNLVGQMDPAARAVYALQLRYEALAAAALGAANATSPGSGSFTTAPTAPGERDWSAFYQGNESAQRALAAATADSDEILKDYLKSLESTGTTSGQAALATEVVSLKFEGMAEASRGLITQLDAQIAKVGELKSKQDAYAQSVKSTLTGSISLEGAWSAASDALGENASSAEIAAKAIELFKQQIADTKAFAESWRSIANEAGAGGQGVIDQLGGVFTAYGKTPGIALATAIHDEGLAPTLAADLTAFDVFAGDVGVAFGSKFYDEGINDAEKVLEGMADKIAKSNKALNRMGRDIGTPIGIAIQAEIEDAIARATKEAANARQRAAENARAADAAAATTPASAGASILRVIANTNARSGYTGANTPVFGVLV